MNRFTNFLLLLVLLAIFVTACRQRDAGLDIGRPVITGSPIIVLHP